MVTVKRSAEAYHASDDKSTLTVNGSEIANAGLLGLVVNKVESVTDISFTFDDGMGQIDINRWSAADFDDIVLHFIECIYVHVKNARVKVQEGVPAEIQTNPIMATTFSNGVK